MNNKTKQFEAIFLLAAILLVGLIVLTGCKKKSQPPAPPKTTEKAASTPIEEKLAEVEKEVQKTPLRFIQRICPVDGLPINMNIFTEYKGKKVYFCCADCKAKFEKESEKYLNKLPQFMTDERKEELEKSINK